MEAARSGCGPAVATGQAYAAYRQFCARTKLHPLGSRTFGDLLAELDIYSLVRARVISKGRYGRSREIVLDLPKGAIARIYKAILLNFQLEPMPAKQAALRKWA